MGNAKTLKNHIVQWIIDYFEDNGKEWQRRRLEEELRGRHRQQSGRVRRRPVLSHERVDRKAEVESLELVICHAGT